MLAPLSCSQDSIALPSYHDSIESTATQELEQRIQDMQRTTAAHLGNPARAAAAARSWRFGHAHGKARMPPFACRRHLHTQEVKDVRNGSGSKGFVKYVQLMSRNQCGVEMARSIVAD